jgi:hypothetical protein
MRERAIPDLIPVMEPAAGLFTQSVPARCRADAEPEAIRSAYKALAKKSHPDRHPGNLVMDTRMKAITAAYAEVMRARGGRQKRR